MKARLIFLTLILALCAMVSGQSTGVQPGDQIRISCPLDASVCVTRTVTRDGYLYIPRLGAVNAAGLSLIQLQSDIQELLHSRGNPCRIVLSEELNPNGAIKVDGSISASCTVPWRSSRHLSYILALVKPTKAADLGAIQITDAVGKVTRWTAAADPLLKAGDQIFIPTLTKPDEILVVGGVKTPGGVPFEPGMDANKAIAKAGGISGHGDPFQISVERDGLKIDPASPLLRGDIVRVGLVTDRRFVSVQGAVKSPGIVEFKEGMTLTDVIEAAGGATIKGDLSHVEVKSMIGRTDQHYDVVAIKQGLKPNVKLLASDIVDVPVLRTQGK